MTEKENIHPHPAPETPTPRDDGPPEGCEADWLKWRSRMNRRRRFQREDAPAPRGEPSSPSPAAT